MTTFSDYAAGHIKNGTKFTDDQAAECKAEVLAWLRAYEGTFGFILDLQSRRSLSIPQIRGAANVWLAELRKVVHEFEPVQTLDLSKAIEFFAKVEKIKWPKVRLVTDDGEHIVIRRKNTGAVDIVTESKDWNDRFQAFMPHWFGRIETDGTIKKGATWKRVADLVIKFTDDPAGTAAAYGKLTGSCSFCGRTIETDESLYVGYGPICADRYGLPWGEYHATEAA